jgi:hypothetical protein
LAKPVRLASLGEAGAVAAGGDSGTVPSLLQTAAIDVAVAAESMRAECSMDVDSGEGSCDDFSDGDSAVDPMETDCSIDVDR